MTLHWSWQKANVAASLWCIAVGVAMMALWLSQPVNLAEQHPFLFGMKFNAALAFAVIGVALLLATRGFRRLPALMMVPVFVYGALALSQHLFGIDAGIDTLLHTPFVDIGTSLPGRIAPNTAFCFMLVSSALALRVLTQENSIVQIGLGFTTFIVAAAASLPIPRLPPLLCSADNSFAVDGREITCRFASCHVCWSIFALTLRACC